MSFLSELLAFVVVGDARYGRERTPLDELDEKATRGLEVARDLEQGRERGTE